ncbi:hypothetical protein [Mycobacterium basiliense]|uniref:hypothetical protein n=1 Tax=Mycobacterium basiliense TaxID=2094119 RepID=UPI001301511D
MVNSRFPGLCRRTAGLAWLGGMPFDEPVDVDGASCLLKLDDDGNGTVRPDPTTTGYGPQERSGLTEELQCRTD